MTYKNLKNYSNSQNSNKPKIGLLIGGQTDYYNPCSYIRLLSPLNELSNDFSFYIIDKDSINEFYENMLKNQILLDILIIQRDVFDYSNIINLEFIKILFEKCKLNSIKIIFDIDDDLLNIDKTHKDYLKFSQLKPILTYLISNSSVITVPNTNLKKQIIHLNENIEIIPNTLMKFWNLNSNRKNNIKPTNNIKIGYFGSTTHGNDIKIVESAIKNIKKYYADKEIIFEVIGVCNDNYEWIKRLHIPNNYKPNPTHKDKIKNFILKIIQNFKNTNNGLAYPNFIEWMKNEIEWDIGVAPLENTNINQSKSNLKYLEYTALNIPGIFSNIGPYKEIGSKNSGLVVNNNTKEWENAILKLIEDHELYTNLLNNAREDIKKNYLVKNSENLWKNLLKNI